MSRFFGLSLHPLQNFELVSSEALSRLQECTGSPEPSLITLVTSSFIMLESSDKNLKVNKTIHGHWVHVQVEVLYVALARMTLK